jgi:hypothetical protein
VSRALTAILFLLITGASSIVAQQPPTPQPLPTFVPPTLDPALFVTPTVAAPVEAAPAPASLGVEQIEALPVLLSARGDLELLADQALGAGQRPVGWSGSIDPNDPQLPLLIRLDVELLATSIMQGDERPPGWFGVVASVPLAVARDVRHDLELLADRVVGASTLRPGGWVGDDPLFRCDRALQALVALLERSGFTLEVDFTQPTYCAEAEQETTLYVESHFIQPVALGGSDAEAAAFDAAQPFQVDNPYVVAFLDRNARQRAGIVPEGTGFRAVARSAADFSNMMLIEGNGFSVYVDYTTTPVSAEAFAALAPAADDALIRCAADWCG